MTPFIQSLNQANKFSTLVDIIHHRASLLPDREALRFLHDDEQTDDVLTYGTLDRRARAIAAVLHQQGAAGQRALLIYPPGPDYICAFLGCLYAGVVAVPAYPPDPLRVERTLPRLLSIVQDCAPRFGLTTSPLLQWTSKAAQLAPALTELRWLASDLAPLGDADAVVPPPLGRDSLAFLQYTSGSTGSPRGVMVSHGNIMGNLSACHEAYGQTPEDRSLLWLPLYHDLGLINLLYTLAVGAPHVAFSPLSFIRRPLRWLEEISRHRATHSGAPDFAYALCLRKGRDLPVGSLDLSCWHTAFCGAEPIRAETLRRFADTFAVHGFDRNALLPAYGLAEVTCALTGFPDRAPLRSLWLDRSTLEAGAVVIAEPSAQNAQEVVSCGIPGVEHKLRIVDADSAAPLPEDQIGEIWAWGASVCQGYWNRPAESAEAFQATIAGTGEGPFVRTGDLGFLHQGLLYITGRIKDLIILHGRNLYPQDLELTAERAHAAVRPGCAAAFQLHADGGERLVLAVEVDLRRVSGAAGSDAGAGSPEKPLAEIATAIRRAAMQQDGVAVDLILLLKAGTIPKTSSGKIQRRATRAEYQAGSLGILLRSQLKQNL